MLDGAGSIGRVDRTGTYSGTPGSMGPGESRYYLSSNRDFYTPRQIHRRERQIECVAITVPRYPCGAALAIFPGDRRTRLHEIHGSASEKFDRGRNMQKALRTCRRMKVGYGVSRASKGFLAILVLGTLSACGGGSSSNDSSSSSSGGGPTAESVRYDFPGFRGLNANPQAALIQGKDGNFYGTTATGGSANAGTIFKVTPAGVETTLYSFTGSNVDGANPRAALIQGSDGNFYGTTFAGGRAGAGTVFMIPP